MKKLQLLLVALALVSFTALFSCNNAAKEQPAEATEEVVEEAAPAEEATEAVVDSTATEEAPAEAPAE